MKYLFLTSSAELRLVTFLIELLNGKPARSSNMTVTMTLDNLLLEIKTEIIPHRTLLCTQGP